ncbi:MAG TPA: DUF2946 domain-containing protein [Piscinibacter sp.]|nr:DUF2946 domain-containing protein [Piscinibacter sp.]HOY36478.1 DUF2946 domain-containing protein [Piscinibacter sp.]
MRAFRAHRRLTTWIAALAILLASLAPSLSHALGSVNGSSWIEICSSQGSKWVEDGSDGTSSVPAAGHAFEHCAFCSTHAPALGLPPSPALAPFPIEGHGSFPPAFYAAPRTQHVWVSSRPRAPPQFY